MGRRVEGESWVGVLGGKWVGGDSGGGCSGCRRVGDGCRLHHMIQTHCQAELAT